MSNKFKEYGFIRKMFQELNCTGVQGEALKVSKYGYSREFNIDNDTRITFNIIANNQPEWICEKVTFNRKVFREICDHEIVNREEFLTSGKGEFDYSMQELGYTISDYRKVSRWAYVESKEEALNEILEQYPYLFE
jgi:hypothetical protein